MESDLNQHRARLESETLYLQIIGNLQDESDKWLRLAASPTGFTELTRLSQTRIASYLKLLNKASENYTEPKLISLITHLEIIQAACCQGAIKHTVCMATIKHIQEIIQQIIWGHDQMH
jgi:hypothetical protein